MNIISDLQCGKAGEYLVCADFLPPVPFFDGTHTFEDCHGLAFAQVRAQLPPRASEWPGREGVKDPALLRFLHQEMWRCSNPWCSNPFWPEIGSPWRLLELHHIVGGRGSRSDERTNTLPLCKWCHQGPAAIVDNFGFVLLLKWLQAGEELDWLRLSVLHGRFLPDLQTNNGEILCESDHLSPNSSGVQMPQSINR